MNLLQLHLHPDRLIRFAAAQGIARAEDEDLGYACHAWLRAMFGALAPKPFRLFDTAPGRSARLLAYSAAAGEAMLDHVRTFADPLAFSAWEEEDFAFRAMPSAWTEGRRLGFEVLVCPMSRKDDTEKDVFLRRLDADPEVKIGRAPVYLEWLARQLTPAATLSTGRLDGFRRIRMLRRSRAEKGGRRLVNLERPQALMTGELVIADAAAFTTLLARGIGRHRAFGYGMLLLRPAT